MRDTARQHPPGFQVRPATPDDLDALIALETAVFATDRMSRRSLQRLLTSPSAAVLVVEHRGAVAGDAVVLFRSSSIIARLYSIAVAPRDAGRGLGPALLAGAEEAALARECQFLRLEVHAENQRAIDRYRKAGFREFGRHRAYYQDKGDALRFEKRLTPRLKGLERPPPYFHQTVDFTCGPACVMMARAWADRSYRPKPADEFRLWRRATTIFMASGPGGCEPYGLAVPLQQFGLNPTVYVSRPGPYFIDTVSSQDKQRVMRVTQDDFRREATALGVVTHTAALTEKALIPALDANGAAIVLVSGHHMIPRGQPHWVFAFGRDGDYVLVHDPAADRDEHGHADAPETYAVPWSHFARMSRNGSDHLSAAILLAKEKPS